MNPNLKQQLAAWEVDLDVPARFQANVWAEVAARESHWRQFWGQAGALFYRPLPVAALVAVALTFSMGTAYVQAQNVNKRNGQEMERLYMQSINPLDHSGEHSL
jgi:hypothetical protein